ncbi:MAG: Na+/H+ antiporter NhaC-like protein [Firmicutes bacterium]|nr:Na+/H+ antiporter NhaC-like protein [Bacillota bacterium]
MKARRKPGFLILTLCTNTISQYNNCIGMYPLPLFILNETGGLLSILLVFILFFVSLLVSIYTKVSLLYPLILGLVCFTLLSLSRGYRFADVVRMMAAGSKKSLIVIKIFVLIGMITAVWRACGTVSFIVYYGIAFMDPHYFLLYAFVLSSIVSFLLGTSFGTVGTVGVVLGVLAQSGGVDINIAAGAIIAGAYFGDRCSPMSSSANLVAALTETKLYINIKNMMTTSIMPFFLSIIGYILLSRYYPLSFPDTAISQEIAQAFDLHSIVLLPALIILLAAAFKVDVKISMGVSILCGIAISLFIQQQTLWQMLHYILTGYTTDKTGYFSTIIQGGGLSSMLNAALIVLLSSAYSGIFAGTNLLDKIEQSIDKLSNLAGTYVSVLFTSIVTAAFSCNQTLAVMLSHQFSTSIYEKRKLSNYQLALDLENTVIVISALIPWNIAGAVPAATLSANESFIPYALYLYLVPLTSLFLRTVKKGSRQPAL